MVKMFNLYYFIAIAVCSGIIVGLYFLLRNKSENIKKIVIFSMLVLNLCLHFLKFLFPPYSLSMDRFVRDVWFINICAASTFLFPFFCMSESKYAKDFMFYLGVLSGALALLYPTEALNSSYTLDVIRFYFCHLTIIAAPLLMVLLNLHKLDYKRIWKMPFYMCGVLLFIICNQVLKSVLGFTALRGSDITKVVYKNSSWIWGPTDDISILISWATPNFMKTIPYGEFKGQQKYWPFFYMLPALFLYFLVFPFILSLPWEFKHFKEDTKKLLSKLKRKK